MFKIDKSILIVCILSLFLLMSQATATDIDSELNDSNTIDDSLKIDNLNANADSIRSNEEDTCRNSINQPNNPIEKNIDLSENSIDDDPSISYETHENGENGENDGEKSITAEEPTKDTAGIVMAGNDYSCGPASLATALNRFGLNLSLNEVSKHTNTSLSGTSMQSLIDAAKYYGFSAVGVEIDTEKLLSNSIVHLNINGNEHWTVISSLTDTHVFLADSTLGNINLSIDEFNSYFTNKAILLSNGSEIDLNNNIITNQIKILDKSQTLKISGKGMKKKVIGYRIVWKYGMIPKYGWVLRPVVKGGHVSFSQWQYVKGTYYVWGKYKVKEPIYKYYYVADDALTSAKINKRK